MQNDVIICDKPLIDNLYIFNMCDIEDVPIRLVLNIYNISKDKKISSLTILEILNGSSFAFAFVSKFQEIDLNYISVYSLLTIDINILIIEMISARFKSIDEISSNLSDFYALGLHKVTNDKILKFINAHYFKSTEQLNKLELALLDILSVHDITLSNDQLFKLLLERGIRCTVSDYFSSVQKLISYSKIIVTSSGCRIKHPNITDYLHNSSNQYSRLLLKLLSGETLDNSDYPDGVSKKIFEREIRQTTRNLPIFENESHYFKSLGNYKLSDKTLKDLGYPDHILYEYIKLKHSLSEKRTELDYILDHQLEDTNIGFKILSENGKIFIFGKVLKRDFKTIFTHYIVEMKIVYFNLEDIMNDFKLYLKDIGQESAIDELPLDVITRKLENSQEFVNCGKKNFYYIDIDNFSFEFLREVTSYLENFYGYGSVLWFLANHKQLCHSHRITNEYQLFSIIKFLFEDEFKSKIEFIRMPTISTKGLDKREFFRNLIEEMQPISVSAFVASIEKRFGIVKSTFLASYSDILDEFRTVDGILSVDITPIDESDKLLLLEIIGDAEVVSYDYFKKVISENLSDKTELYLNPIIIKRLGYKKTNLAIYKNNYSSLDDAFIGYSGKADMVIPSDQLVKAIHEQIIENKFYLIINKCFLLKFSETSYLNTNKRINRREVLEFRNELIASLIDHKIYTLDTLYESQEFGILMQKYRNIEKMINSLGTLILESIIKSSLEISVLFKNDVFVFARGVSVTKNYVVKQTLLELGISDRYELQDRLRSRYGIEIEITRGMVLEMGSYYHSDTDMIYASRNLYEQELEDYLSYEMDS